MGARYDALSAHHGSGGQRLRTAILPPPAETWEERLRKLGDKNLVLIEALVPELDILTAPHRLDHRQMGRFLGVQ